MWIFKLANVHKNNKMLNRKSVGLSIGLNLMFDHRRLLWVVQTPGLATYNKADSFILGDNSRFEIRFFFSFFFY